MTSMKILVVIILLLVSSGIYCQKTEKQESLLIDPIINVYPVFSGGDDSLFCFFERSFNYERLNFNNSKGKVIVEFEIDTFGKVKNIMINPNHVLRFKGLIQDSIVNYEIYKVFRSMPLWKSGTQLGKKVKCKMSIQIKIPYTDFKCLGLTNDETICKDVDILADFKGFKGKTKKERIYNFINSKLNWPNTESDCIGNVTIQCVVETNGKLSNFRIIQNLCSEYDKEALRVVRLMPNWTPAIKNGKSVRSLIVIPVRFALR
jgi:TonB family protein